MTDDRMEPGEIQRTLARIELTLESVRTENRAAISALSASMQSQLGPISIHTVEIAALKEKQNDLVNDVKDVVKKANFVSGAWSAVTVFLGIAIAWFREGVK